MPFGLSAQNGYFNDPNASFPYVAYVAIAIFLAIAYLIEQTLLETTLKQIRHLLPEMKPIRDF